MLAATTTAAARPAGDVAYYDRKERLIERLMDMRFATLDALAIRCGFRPRAWAGHRMDMVHDMAAYIADLMDGEAA